MSPEFRVQLVSVRLWNPLVTTAFQGLHTSQAQRLARSILTALHNRHVGITPYLVAELTPLLLDPQAHLHGQGTWAAVLRRLNDELLSGAKHISQSRQRSFGLFLSSAPIYGVMRLVMPIVEIACRHISRCYLFCADDIEAGVQPDDYAIYAQALAQKIVELAQSEAGEFELFWRERAVTLSSLSRQPARFDCPNPALPEVDPAALSFLLRLEPDLPSAPQHIRRQQLPLPFHHPRIQRQKESGVDGIRLTRRIEDIGDMLLTEFIYPKMVRADRLLNSGYLALQRQTRREERRNVFIAALMPGEVRTGLGADFIKACWFDCLVRLSLLLRQHHLAQSEFRWVEGDHFGQVRTCAFLLQELPTVEPTLESRPSPAYRQAFLAGLRWLPAYLDTRDHFSPLPAPEGALAETTDPLSRWVLSAWAAQQDHLLWNQAAREQTLPLNRLKTEAFELVHVMLFLPAAKRERVAFGLSELYRGLGLHHHPGWNLSITWLPCRLDEKAEWLIETSGHPRIRLSPSASSGLSDRQVAGRLVYSWLNQFIKEIWCG